MSGLSTLARIRQTCRLEVGPRMIMSAVLPSLRAWLPHEAAFFFWLDPGARAVAAASSGSGELKGAGEWASLCPPLMANLAVAIATDGVLVTNLRTLPVASVGRRVDSARADWPDWRLMAMAVGSAEGRQGILLLIRSRHDRAFGREDRRHMASLSPHLAMALDRPVEEYPWVASDESGILMIDRAGRLEQSCVVGRALLRQAAGPDGLQAGDLLATEAELLAGLAEAASRAGTTGLPARMKRSLRNDLGLFEFRVVPLEKTSSDDVRLAINVRRFIPEPLKILLSVDGLHLSPRQRELIVLLGSSLQNVAIADRLGLRPGTVSSMVKDLYRRIGINSRHALRELLLHGA